ncbi:hypothetical protein GCM10010383_10630 [Streptomyces lomondensis]|uniref:Uncharacterized protein n=1 Tax=Streptomyces lomondensis TaxID=68229 RepID=A0ABQ2WWH6_9ACTN|nr:hypothetical protein GCM10010383_10630 [Streptomyces lomondensis]
MRCGGDRYRAQGGGRDGQEADRDTGAPVEPGRCKALMGPHGKPLSFRWRTGTRQTVALRQGAANDHPWVCGTTPRQ